MRTPARGAQGGKADLSRFTPASSKIGNADALLLSFRSSFAMEQAPRSSALGARKGLREIIVLGAFQAPFPPAVAHRLLLSALTAAIE